MRMPTVVPLSSLPDPGFGETACLVDGESESVILHRTGTTVRAWLNVCPHAGRRLDWAPGQFLLSQAGELVCAVHGASFRLADGFSTGGPCAGASLRAVPVAVDGDEVRVGG